MDMEYFFNTFESNLTGASAPIRSLELVHSGAIFKFDVGRSYRDDVVKIETLRSTLPDIVIVHIEEMGQNNFNIYSMDEDNRIYLSSSVSASESSAVSKTYFRSYGEWAQLIFSRMVPEESNSVKELFGSWVARDSKKEIVFVDKQEDVALLLNRNVGHHAVICKDNFDRENRPERFVSGDFSQRGEAEKEAERLNNLYGGEYSEDYFEVVTLPYDLFMPDF